jgi:hypothetical protein
MYPCKQAPAFQKKKITVSIFRAEAYFSEMLVSTYDSTKHHGTIDVFTAVRA